MGRDWEDWQIVLFDSREKGRSREASPIVFPRPLEWGGLVLIPLDVAATQLGPSSTFTLSLTREFPLENVENSLQSRPFSWLLRNLTASGG